MPQKHAGFESQGPITFTDESGQFLRLPRLTTAQRDALEASDGMEIYNTDTGQKESYSNGGWGVSLRSNPPDGFSKLKNVYLDEEEKEIVIITEEE